MIKQCEGQDLPRRGQSLVLLEHRRSLRVIDHISANCAQFDWKTELPRKITYRL
jgi:hypothetical protein